MLHQAPTTNARQSETGALDDNPYTRVYDSPFFLAIANARRVQPRHSPYTSAALLDRECPSASPMIDGSAIELGIVAEEAALVEGAAAWRGDVGGDAWTRGDAVVERDDERRFALEAFHRDLIGAHLERELRAPRVIRDVGRERVR